MYTVALSGLLTSGAMLPQVSVVATVYQKGNREGIQRPIGLVLGVYHIHCGQFPFNFLS